MYYSFDPEEIVSPFDGDRSISMLMRFAYTVGDGKNLVEHYGHRLRHEIVEHWKADPLEGSEQGLRTPEVNLITFLCLFSLCVVSSKMSAAREMHKRLLY